MNVTRTGCRHTSAAIIAAVSSCLAPAALATPAALTDTALDAVTAGTGPPLQAADGKPPTVVVADGAEYTFAGDQRVRLQDDAQIGARALNLVGAAGSDVGNAVNVLTLNADITGQALQQNLVRQSESGTGALGRASLVGGAVEQSHRFERHFTESSASSLLTGSRTQSRVSVSTVDQNAAFVPEYRPLQNLTLEVATPTLAPVHIAEFDFDEVNETDLGEYGVRGAVGPITLTPPELVLGTFSLDGDDVVLSSGYLQMPTVELGSASLEVCVVTCFADTSVDLGSYAGPRIDFPQADLRLEGANPFQDTYINAGHGIAAVGSGSVNITPAHVTLSGELTLDLPDPTIEFDFTIPGFEFGDLGSVGPWEIDGPDVVIEIPPVTVAHTLIDEDVGFAYSATFDGVLCVVQGTSDCGPASRHKEQHESRIDELVYVASDSSFASGGAVMSGDESVHMGATLKDAEADLIAMSQASALIDATSSIELSDSAQRGIRVLNGVNAADTMVGNGLNVTAFTLSRVTPGVSGSLDQSNVFVQYRTRYGR